MGVDKFAMVINGQPQWKFMVDELSEFFDEVHISCRQDQAAHFNGHPVVMDEVEDIGPMGAIYSSFRQISGSNNIFFIACDLPGFDVSIAKNLHAHLLDKYDVVAAMNPESGSKEPLVAFWNRSALPMIEQFIEQENYALFKCMNQLRTKAIMVSDSLFLRNVNSPSDL